jgi:hypothetical protein
MPCYNLLSMMPRPAQPNPMGPRLQHQADKDWAINLGFSRNLAHGLGLGLGLGPDPNPSPSPSPGPAWAVPAHLRESARAPINLGRTVHELPNCPREPSDTHIHSWFNGLLRTFYQAWKVSKPFAVCGSVVLIELGQTALHPDVQRRTTGLPGPCDSVMCRDS